MSSLDVSTIPAPSRTTVSGLPLPTPSIPITSPRNLFTQPPVLNVRDTGDPPTATSDCPNEVVVVISTQVLIPDYREYYTKTPIQEFTMRYNALPDGSLVTHPYMREVQQTNWFLLLIGMLFLLFLRNTIVSADYIRRGRVKRKELFYTLFISQATGLTTFIIMAASYFLNHVNCRVVMIAEGFLTEFSASLMLSGILGLKAYRCLNNSKFVLAVIMILQAVSTVLVLLDLLHIRAIRRLAMNCTAVNKFRFLPLAVGLRFVIALFICVCFVYALWKASKCPAAQGRISLRFSEHVASEVQTVSEKDDQASMGPQPRGWWDYVPETEKMNNKVPAPGPGRLRPSWNAMEDGSFMQNMRAMFLSKARETYFQRHHRRSASEPGVSAQRRRTTVHFQDNEKSYFEDSRAPSPTQSQAGSLGKVMNRMKLFREMLRNELAHTALIALTNVIATVLILVGVFCIVPVSPALFIGAYWAVLSLTVMNSFARVIQRHERDALLHHPSAWDPLYHVEKATNGNVRRALSTASVASNPFRAKSTIELLDEQDGPESKRPSPPRVAQQIPQTTPDNPFEDFEFVSKSISTLESFTVSGYPAAETFAGRRPVSASSWNSRDHNDRRPSVPVSLSSRTRDTFLSWESQLKPRNPNDNAGDLFYQSQTVPRSPESKYSVR